ncbi:MAG TPA: HD domain-containing protein [Caulobacteraceae bacterium]|nr:HD domain-containing protein [Caulobacteraceae bacterium]
MKSPGEAADRACGFSAMTEASRADWLRVAEFDAAFAKGLPDRVLGLLRLLDDDCHGFAINRFQHCLQAATRAHRAGRSEQYVVCALLHDVGAALAPAKHGEFAALILKPYVSARNHWMLRHHDVFQGYYFQHFFGGDRNARERYRGHPHFEYTAEFCRDFDQSSFDASYDAMPLTAFEPMLRRLLSTPAI